METITNDIKKKRAYEIFQQKCSKMVECKFLLAQPCIANVLKCIIASPELYQFIKDTVSNIDCEVELSKATLDNEYGTGIALPESKRVMIALVTYLLNQFDNNGIDLMEFIAYYYNQDTTMGYQAFCQEVVLPYCKAIGELFINLEPVEEDNNEPISVNSVVFEQADLILRDIATTIQADNSLMENERTELSLLVEGMMIAVSNSDAKMIVSLWIGMKYSFSRNRKITKSLKDLNKLLLRYSII